MPQLATLFLRRNRGGVFLHFNLPPKKLEIVKVQDFGSEFLARFSPPAVAKCVRTILRIVHQTGNCRKRKPRGVDVLPGVGSGLVLGPLPLARRGRDEPFRFTTLSSLRRSVYRPCYIYSFGFAAAAFPLPFIQLK